MHKLRIFNLVKKIHTVAPAKGLLLLLASLVLSACGDNDARVDAESSSPYILIFAGDKDGEDSDFLAMIDVDPESDTRGEAILSTPINHRSSMPHHMEYVPPPDGEPIFLNAHHVEESLIVDASIAGGIKIKSTFSPPAPLRFPHDYTRTPNGTRLVGFLRSQGPSPDPDEQTSPGNHGGIAEYSVDGELLRTASAAVAGLDKPVRPYAFAILPEQDRFIVTSAPMMEKSWAEVVQIFRYSDFSLLHTIALPVGQFPDGTTIANDPAAGFGPRVLDDGSVFLNSYSCAFYHLTQIASDAPQINVVHALKTKPSAHRNAIPGACGIPFRIGRYWIQPAGDLNAVVVLDILDPKSPKEVFRLATPKDFNPHWLAKDPLADRLILGAELGGEQGFFILQFDRGTGSLSFDKSFRGAKKSRFFSKKRDGYISLEKKAWPHGKTGYAWGHAALFLNE